MKSFLVLIVGTVLFLGCSDSKGLENDLKSDNLRGNIKSLNKKSFVVNVVNNEIKKGRKCRGDYCPRKDQYHLYNKKGDRIESIYYDLDGNIDLRESTSYESNGNKIEVVTQDSDGSVYISETYEYDNRGRVIEEILYNDKGIQKTLKYKYNVLGRLKEKITYRKTGDEDNRLVYSYYLNGNLKKECLYLDEDEVLKTKKYKYDDNSNCTEINEYFLTNPDGSTNFVYDENDRVIYEEVLDFRGDEIESFYYQYDDFDNEIILEIKDYGSFNHTNLSYKYEYDFYQNWLRRITFVDEIPKYMIEREITYHE
jgi:hypothetical protein